LFTIDYVCVIAVTELATNYNILNASRTSSLTEEQSKVAQEIEATMPFSDSGDNNLALLYCFKLHSYIPLVENDMQWVK
jgi:hypothetical protein